MTNEPPLVESRNIQQPFSLAHLFNINVLPWIICGLAAGFYCYEYLLRITPGLMVAELQQAFSVHGEYLDATLIATMSAYYYRAYTPMQLPAGLLMDRYGPRWILTLAVFCCALGTIIFGKTHSVWWASFGRFLMGFGSAFAFVGVLKLASAWLPANRFAMVTGLATTLGMIGAMMGGVLLTDLIQVIGWRETILYSSYAGLILLPIVWLIVRDAPPPEIARYIANDSTGEITCQSYSQLWKEIVYSIKNRQIWLNGIIGGLLMTPTMVFPELWGKSYLQTVHQFTARDASQAVTMIFLGWAVGSPLVGLLSDWLLRRKLPLIIGGIITTLLLILFLYYPGLTLFQIKALMFLIGVTSSVEVICFAIGRENCPNNLAGTAVAVTNFLVVLFAFSQVLCAKILDYTWDGNMVDNIKVYNVDSYQSAMLVLPVATLLAFLLSFFLRETYCRPHASSLDDQPK